MLVKHEELDTKGAFIATEEGVKVGEMTYSKAGYNKIIIDHTEVDENQKGKGIGKILLFKLVDFVREHNIKVIPLCPFAKSVFDKDIDIRDVLA